MQSDATYCRFEELAGNENGAIAIGPFGSRLKADAYVDSGVSLIRGTNLAGSKYLAGDFVYITEEKARELGNANLKPTDLVFPHRGNIGSVGLVPDDGKRYVLSTSLMKITLDASRALPAFYYYFFRSEAGRAELLKNASQVGTPGIATPLTSLRGCIVPRPPLERQKAVVGVLDALDERIELLRLTNNSLESIAQAIFRSWFIDFDPVRAKADGREPEGMDAATAALFPSGFEESALGLIPKGWQARSLDSIANYLNGLALQKYPPESEDEFLPVIKIAQLRAGSVQGADRASARLKPEYVVQDGDVLFSWSGSLEVEFWCGGDGALNQHLFKVTSKEVPKWFYYLATKHHLPSFRDTAAHKATTMGHIQRRHLTEARVAVPPAAILNALSNVIGPLVERRVANSLQSRHLTAIRDSLLPRLISGKIPVRKISNYVEESVVA